MKRFSIYVIYDPQSIIDEYVNVMLRELRKYSSRLVIVCNFPKENVDNITIADEIIYRENYGFDAAAYSEAIINNRELIGEYDELLITNDTYYGPIIPFKEMFNRMDEDDCDYWGITRHPGGYCGKVKINGHIQSYFLNFKSRVIHDREFYNFWENLEYGNNLDDVIINFEVGINNYLDDRGYHSSSYMDNRGFNLPLCMDNNPYLVYPYELIFQYNIPIIKRRSLSFDNDKFDDAVKALETIREKTEYDCELIIKHIKRLSTIHSNYVKYNYENLDKFISNHKTIYIYGNGKWAKNMDAYFRLHMMRKPKHIVSNIKDIERNVIAFSDIMTTENAGIIIAVSNYEAIKDIYKLCLSKIKREDIFVPIDR